MPRQKSKLYPTIEALRRDTNQLVGNDAPLNNLKRLVASYGMPSTPDGAHWCGMAAYLQAENDRLASKNSKLSIENCKLVARRGSKHTNDANSELREKNDVLEKQIDALRDELLRAREAETRWRRMFIAMGGGEKLSEMLLELRQELREPRKEKE
jgi:hypothetical protein